MTPRIIQTREEFDALRAPWNDLVERIEHSEPFYCWEWAAANIDHLLSADDELFIIVLERGEELFAVAPLFVQSEGFGPFRGRVLRTITGNHADYGSFYLHPGFNHRDIIKRIFKVLFANRDRWDLLHLLNFNSRSPQSFLIADVARTEFDTPCEFSEQILTPYFRFGEDEPKILRKERKNIERRERALRENHDVEITIDGPFSEAFWDKLLELHLAKWPESIFSDPRTCAFMREIIRTLEPAGRTTFSWMKIDGEFAALEFGFKTPTKVGTYIPIFDPKFASFSPGGILLRHLFEHFGKEKEELDFMRGNESYKFFWTDSVAANHNLLIESGSAKSRALARLIRIKDQFRDVDWLRKAYRSALSRAAL